jgi:hypothetical protein
VSSLHSCDPLAYSDNECAKQLLYALDDHVWGMKIIDVEQSVDFATLDIEKLFSKLKSHELSRKGRLNHEASLTSKSYVGGHDANPANTVLSALEFALSSLATASDDQYEGIPDDEIALLARKFRALHKFHNERRRSPGVASSMVTPPTSSTDCPKRKKFDSSNKNKNDNGNKYDYTNRNDSSNKGDSKKKSCFRDNKKKKF